MQESGYVRDETEDSEVDGEREHAYFRWPGWKYYTLVLILYASCVVGAIFVKDLATVFDFVGAFGLSLTSFTLPGSMYLLMLKNERARTSFEIFARLGCHILCFPFQFYFAIGAIGSLHRNQNLDRYKIV